MKGWSYALLVLVLLGILTLTVLLLPQADEVKNIVIGIFAWIINSVWWLIKIVTFLVYILVILLSPSILGYNSREWFSKISEYLGEKITGWQTTIACLILSLIIGTVWIHLVSIAPSVINFSMGDDSMGPLKHAPFWWGFGSFIAFWIGYLINLLEESGSYNLDNEYLPARPPSKK